MEFETSWDDGSKFDSKLVNLLQKYNIPGVLYIPIHCEIGLDWVKEVSDLPGIEIGGHTVTHPTDLKALPPDHLEYEIKTGKEMMETAIGKKIDKFCYPRGRYNEVVKKMVKSAGFKEGRTTKVLYHGIKDPFEKPTTVHVFNRKEYLGNDWFDVAKSTLDMSLKTNSYFHLWGHSWEVEKYNQWEQLEKFFQHVNETICIERV